MRLASISLLCGLVLTGCCTTLRESVRAYGQEAAANTATTRLLVERYRQGDDLACEGALDALEEQRRSALLIAGQEGAQR